MNKFTAWGYCVIRYFCYYVVTRNHRSRKNTDSKSGVVEAADKIPCKLHNKLLFVFVNTITQPKINK